ncbi:MAG: ATP-binding protein, partial [Bacteroidales bacterium]|nr:ATP-binding protein [Bacteroidales bacterium]
VIAFLNYKEGGYVYFGIDKDGDVIGIDNVDECMLKIKDRLKNNISPLAETALSLWKTLQESYFQ